MRLNIKENLMFKNNVFTIITAGYWSERVFRNMWVTLRGDAAHQLMCLLSFLLWVCCSFFCIYCCWMCIILYKTILIVTFLFFVLFFCVQRSPGWTSSVVIKPSQGAGWWWSVLADFFVVVLKWFLVLALSFYVDGTNSWLFECWLCGVWWIVVVCKPGRYYQNYPPNVLLVMLKQN